MAALKRRPFWTDCCPLASCLDIFTDHELARGCFGGDGGGGGGGGSGDPGAADADMDPNDPDDAGPGVGGGLDADLGWTDTQGPGQVDEADLGWSPDAGFASGRDTSFGLNWGGALGRGINSALNNPAETAMSAAMMFAPSPVGLVGLLGRGLEAAFGPGVDGPGPETDFSEGKEPARQRGAPPPRTPLQDFLTKSNEAPAGSPAGSQGRRRPSFTTPFPLGSGPVRFF